MNAQRLTTGLAVVAALVFSTTTRAEPVGTAFLFQGQLREDGKSLNDTCDFNFDLYDASTDGLLIGSNSVSGVAVVDGLFEAALDFGAGAFTGEARHLEIAAKCTGNAVFTTLTPRQPVTATPYTLQTRGLFVDDNGNVGVGTTDPVFGLNNRAVHIVDDDVSVFVAEHSGSGAITKLTAEDGVGHIGMQGPHPLRIVTNDVTRMVVTGSGEVGVGTTTTEAKLHVLNDANQPALKVQTASAIQDQDIVQIRHSSNSFNAAGLLVQLDGSYSQLGPNAYFIRTFSTNENAHPFVVKGDGNVGVGTLTPSERLHVVGNICATGTIGACSDGRFKENVKRIPEALGKLLKLRGVRFDWNRDAYPDHQFSDKRQVGFIAQEIKQVLPEAVSQGSDGFYSVDYGRVAPLLVEAVKELHHSVGSKETQLAAQRQQIAELTARLERMEAIMGELTATPKRGVR